MNLDRITSSRREKRLLQIAVALAGTVPVAAGMAGVVFGEVFVGDLANISSDSHFRYLSGILLAVGLAFWSSIPRIEMHALRYGLLTLLVFTGGLARLAAIPTMGTPNGGMLFGLAMELAVTPILCLWQFRVARRAGARGPL